MTWPGTDSGARGPAAHGPPECGPERDHGSPPDELAQGCLHDLAGGADLEHVDDPHLIGYLVAGELTEAVALQLLRGRLGARRQLHEGHDAFAEPLIGGADDRRPGH